MMACLELILVVICVVIALLWWNQQWPENFPPGPTGIPILGYGPFLGKYPHIAVTKLGEKFGNLYGLRTGVNRLGIVLNDWKAVKEALVEQPDVFSGRPQDFVMKQIFRERDIVFTQGQLWKDKRRFALHHLRNLGFGRASMESVIAEEVQHVQDIIDARTGQKIDVAGTLFLPILNIIWGLIAGKKYAMDDEKMLRFSTTLKNFAANMQDSLAVNAVPILRFVPGSLSRSYRNLVKDDLEIEQFIADELKEHENTYKDGVERDFIDIYLAEIYKHKDQGKHSLAFQNHQLIGTMKDFFAAGVETTLSTLSWAFLYMALWPEIQEKVQRELDQVIGKGRSPVYSDKSLLPYTEAVILEIHRYSTIVPFSVPHQTNRTTQLMGYTIPKDTFVLQNLWAVHRDPNYWEEPETFRPERFINDEGETHRPEYLIPFSTGPRMCLGEPLARMELFMFFTNILHRYSLHCVTGEEPPSLERVPSITIRPLSYSLIFRQRL